MIQGKIKNMPQNLQNTVVSSKELNLEEEFGSIDLKVEQQIKDQKQNSEIYEYLDQSEPIEEENAPDWDEVEPN